MHVTETYESKSYFLLFIYTLMSRVRFGEDEYRDMELTEEVGENIRFSTDVILDFLEKSVEDIVHDLSKDLTYEVSKKDRVHWLYKAIAETVKRRDGFDLKADHIAISSTILDWMDTKPIAAAEAVQLALAFPNNYVLRKSVITLIRMGMKSFIDFNQCMNQCHKVVNVAAGRVVTRIGVRVAFQEVCLDSYARIESALGINNHPNYSITHFDVLLQEASGGTCSIVRKH